MALRSAWGRGVLLLLIAVAAYFQTWIDLWPYWANKDATYTHGTLVALTAIWLVWEARRPLAGVSAAANPLVLPLVLLLSAVWLIAARAHVMVGHAMVWPILAFTILWAGVGWRAASRFVFPLGFLYFAIPFWELFKPPLQAMSAFMVGTLTAAIGIPAHVDGPYVMLPDATIYIALDCSGAHFLSVALAVGAIAVKNRGDGLRSGLVIMALAAGLSMVFNWLRILLIVLAYLHPDLKEALEKMGHLTFGWWVFALDLVAFALVLRFVPAAAPAKATEAPTVTSQPTVTSAPLGAYAAAAAVALLLPLSSLAAHVGQGYPDKDKAPFEVAGLTGPIGPDPRWEPRSEGAAWTHRAAYMTPDGRVVELYGSEYHEQTQGRELISRGFPLFDPQYFPTQTSETKVLGAGDRTLEVTQVALRDKIGRDWAAVYTYVVDGRVIASGSRAQLMTALHSVYGKPVAGVLAVMMPCRPDCGAIDKPLGTAMLAAHEAYRRARE